MQVGIQNILFSFFLIYSLNKRCTGRWDEEEETIHEPVQKVPRVGGGVAIAPPPSLQEPQETALIFPSKPPPTSYSGSSVAAKIMAKYGFKEGQGLGKQEQGMSMALQVEKTSKRGGRIIHEKEILPQPPPTDPNATEPSITEIMKTPSKVFLILLVTVEFLLKVGFLLIGCTIEEYGGAR